MHRTSLAKLHSTPPHTNLIGRQRIPPLSPPAKPHLLPPVVSLADHGLDAPSPGQPELVLGAPRRLGHDRSVGPGPDPEAGGPAQREGGAGAADGAERGLV